MPDMQRFINTLQQISANERQAARPMAICFGKKLVLTKEFLIVKTGVSASSFKVGDVLILFRNEGGQKYLIFDKKGAL